MSILKHNTVLLNEVVDSLKLEDTSLFSKDSSNIVVDCTAGYGGHLGLVLERLEKLYPDKNYKIIAIDRDEEAISFLNQKFLNQIQEGNLVLVHDRFSNLKYILQDLGIKEVNGIYADLGVSTHQILSSNRGFSFINDGPLDMRMGSNGVSAYDIVNDWSEADIIKILKEYGEEPKARFIAHAIVERRKTSPIKTTHELKELIEKNVFYKEKSKKNIATKTFMALRIAVNNELEEVTDLIDVGFSFLKKGGIFSIISFHSLEDRIVKKKFVTLTGKDKYQELSRDVVLTQKELDDLVGRKASIIKPFPIVPTDKELEENPRSRSAKLRVIMKD